MIEINKENKYHFEKFLNPLLSIYNVYNVASFMPTSVTWAESSSTFRSHNRERYMNSLRGNPPIHQSAIAFCISAEYLIDHAANHDLIIKVLSEIQEHIGHT